MERRSEGEGEGRAHRNCHGGLGPKFFFRKWLCLSHGWPTCVLQAFR